MMLSERFTKQLYIRTVAISLCNVFVLLFFVKEHTIIVLSILSLLVYFAGTVASKNRREWIVTLTAIFITLLFIIRNYEVVLNLLQYSWFDFVKSPLLSVQKLGLSYIFFKYLYWLRQCRLGVIKKSNFLAFINYILFFPTVLAGPIDEYTNFHFWFYHSKQKVRTTLAFAGVTRLLLGAFKTLILVPLVITYATNYELLLPSFQPVLAILISAFYYSLYIYMDFSGYSDLAIGTSYLMGIKVPENFDNPYFSSNLSDFWKRWHMSFSKILNELFFRTSIEKLNKWLNIRYRSLLITISGYLFTFMICGLWHGTTLNFVWWGLWHGVGLALLKVWQLKVSIPLGWKISSWYNLTSTFITFAFVSIGWLFFHYDSDSLIKMMNLILS